MLSHEDNEVMCRVGPGTPGGELLRRYWQPIAGEAELTAENPKMRVRALGEDLVLPHIATWWCGQQSAREHVIANLDSMVVARTFQTPTLVNAEAGQFMGSALDAAERAALVERIRQRGYDYVGQEAITLSTAPAWENGRLVARPMALRVFATALGDDYVVMPGGLTRISESNSTRAVSMQRGSGSKDTWVL